MHYPGRSHRSLIWCRDNSLDVTHMMRISWSKTDDFRRKQTNVIRIDMKMGKKPLRLSTLSATSPSQVAKRFLGVDPIESVSVKRTEL